MFTYFIVSSLMHPLQENVDRKRNDEMASFRLWSFTSDITNWIVALNLVLQVCTEECQENLVLGSVDLLQSLLTLSVF